MTDNEPWYITKRMPIGIAKNGSTIYRIEEQDNPDESRLGRAWAYQEYGGREWFPNRRKMSGNDELSLLRKGGRL